MDCLATVHSEWADHFGPMSRLMPTSAATTLRKSDGDEYPKNINRLPCRKFGLALV